METPNQPTSTQVESSKSLIDQLKFIGQWLYDLIFIAPLPIRHIIILILVSLLLIFGTGQGGEIFRIAFENYEVHDISRKLLYFVVLLIGYGLFALVIYVQCRSIYDLYMKKKGLDRNLRLIRIREMEDFHAYFWAMFPLVILGLNYIVYFGFKRTIVHIVVIVAILAGLVLLILYRKQHIVLVPIRQKANTSSTERGLNPVQNSRENTKKTYIEHEQTYRNLEQELYNLELERDRIHEELEIKVKEKEERKQLKVEQRSLAEADEDESLKVLDEEIEHTKKHIEATNAAIKEKTAVAERKMDQLITISEEQFIRVIDHNNIKAFKWIVLLAVGLFAILIFIPNLVYFNSMVLAFGGIMFWSYIVTQIVLWRKNKALTKVPVFLILLGIAIIFSNFNNNHSMRADKGKSALDNTVPIKSHFEEWLDYQVQQPYFFQDSIARIYILSSEGGGIRSAYWTTGLLAQLYNAFPHLMDKTYAMSGVSGGSVGLATFNLYYHDYLLPEGQPAVEDIHKKILGNDLLSPLLQGMLSRDLVQRFIPFPIYQFDRAINLEDAWSGLYRKAVNTSSADSSIFHLYKGENKLRIPNMFFNTTRVETGNKSLISNLSLDPQFFPRANDLCAISDDAFLIKSSTFASARFPFVTPVAKVEAPDSLWGLIVDGGYFDNTGLHTAIEIQDMMIHQIELFKKDALAKKLMVEKGIDTLIIKPTILFFKNSKGTADNEQEPMSSLYESTAPIKTFYNSWMSRAQYFAVDVVAYAEEAEFDYAIFNLPYEYEGRKLDFPLGWSLSLQTQDTMDILIKKTASDPKFSPALKALKDWEDLE